MIAVVDYGVGNLFSLVSSLKYIGEDAIVTSDADVLRRADRIILPGVGAFGDAADKLRASGLVEVLYEQCGGLSDNDEIRVQAVDAKPMLGICLGMQMLFEKSYEYGQHAGLGFVKGEVVPFELPQDMKVPHMGWNSLQFVDYMGGKSSLFDNVREGEYVYYVHSYYARKCEQNTVATSDYGVKVTGAVQNKNIFGTQFHPEKSGDTGLRILKTFCAL